MDAIGGRPKSAKISGESPPRSAKILGDTWTLPKRLQKVELEWDQKGVSMIPQKMDEIGVKKASFRKKNEKKSIKQRFRKKSSEKKFRKKSHCWVGDTPRNDRGFAQRCAGLD